MPEVKTYQQADEPSDQTPGTTWLNDNGKAYIRKLDLSWNYIGEWQLPNMHHLHVEGGTMLGPILGAHGLMPVNNPTLTGTATLNDIELADKQWTRTALENYISGALGDGSTSNNVTIGSNIAFGFGVLPHGGTVPLPKYLGDVTAKISDIVMLQVAPDEILHWNSRENDFWSRLICRVNPTTLVVSCYTETSVIHDKYMEGTVQYIIACMKTS